MKKMISTKGMDSFLFTRLLKDDEVCRRVLETLLGIKLVKASVFDDGISFDFWNRVPVLKLEVCLEEDDGSYEAKLTRAFCDSSNRFTLLLCREDSFGYGLPVYNLGYLMDREQSLFRRNNGFPLFYNLDAWNVEERPELKSLLFFMRLSIPTDFFTVMLMEKLKEMKKKYKKCVGMLEQDELVLEMW